HQPEPPSPTGKRTPSPLPNEAEAQTAASEPAAPTGPSAEVPAALLAVDAPASVAVPVSPAAATEGRAVPAPVEAAPALQDAGPDIPAWEDLPPEAEAEVKAEVKAEAHVPPPAEAEVTSPVDTDDFPAFDDFEPADLSDAGWEPVIEGGEMDPADLAAASLGAGGLAGLAADAGPTVSRPRLARMTAEQWPDLAASLPLSGLADELARQSEWVGVEGDTITLRVAIWSLAAKQGQARLRTVLTEHFGKVVNLKIIFGETGSGTARALEEKRRAERQRQAEEAVANDPFVRTLIDEFGAQVIPGTIAALDERAA